MYPDGRITHESNGIVVENLTDVAVDDGRYESITEHLAAQQQDGRFVVMLAVICGVREIGALEGVALGYEKGGNHCTWAWHESGGLYHGHYGWTLSGGLTDLSRRIDRGGY